MSQFGPDPVYTMLLPRSVVLTCLAALGKLPFEQVAGAHAVLAAEAQQAEERMMMLVIQKQLMDEQRNGQTGP